MREPGYDVAAPYPTLATLKFGKSQVGTRISGTNGGFGDSPGGTAYLGPNGQGCPGATGRTTGLFTEQVAFSEDWAGR